MIRILDGANATEFQRRGVEVAAPAWTNGALIDHPEVVQDVHRAYLRAGADVITANTFRLNQRCLREMGAVDQGQRLRDLAVSLVRDAIELERPGEGCWIAGSVAPVEDCYDPTLVPADDVLEAEHLDAVVGLVAAGVDVIFAETMNTIREAAICARVCQRLHARCFVSFTCRRDGALLSGESLADAAAALAPLGVDGLMINCTGLTGIRNALAGVARGTIAGCYPNIEARSPELHGTHVNAFLGTAESPADLACFALETIASHGLTMFGGCCGSTPGHIAQLAASLRARRAA